MENVVVYARFSSHSQTEQSIEGQLKVCKEYAERNNYRIIHEYIDRAMSGTSDKRPEFQKMIEDSKNRHFKYVLVYQLDRFARDRYDSATYKHKLKKNGVRVISAKENISADASGILMESVLEGMAEYYSAELAQKIKRGMEISAKKCKFIGGKRVFGFNITPEKDYVINEEEAYWVKYVFDSYLLRIQPIEIIETLKKHGIKTTSNKDFTHDSLFRLLGNRKYIGEYSCGNITIEHGIPQIIDDETFEKVSLIRKMKSERSISWSNQTQYCLTGKIYCAECGQPLIGDSCRGKMGKKYYYYTCINRKKKHTCKLPSFPKEELEKSVVESVKNLMSDELIITIVDRAISKINKENSSIDQIKQLKKELKEIKIKIDKFTDLLIEDRNIKLIMDKIDSLKLEEERISKLIYDLQSSDVSISREDVIKKLQQIRDYDYMQPNNIQLFIDSFVEAIYVDKNKKIVVVLSLDNNYYSTEHSWCSDKSLMVELKRIELSTS